MNASEFEFFARPPRHEIIAAESISIQVHAVPDGSVVVAEIINLSRQGVQLLVPTDFPSGQSIELVFTEEMVGANVTQSAVVCWCRQDKTRPEMYDVGCKFGQAIEWEAMGELFLRGILSTDGGSG